MAINMLGRLVANKNIFYKKIIVLYFCSEMITKTHSFMTIELLPLKVSSFILEFLNQILPSRFLDSSIKRALPGRTLQLVVKHDFLFGAELKIFAQAKFK